MDILTFLHKQSFCGEKNMILLATWSHSGYWNNPMADKLPSLLESGDSQRGQSGKDHLSESRSVSSLPARMHFCFLPLLTFLKMMGSSSHTGLMALLFWEVLVLRAFLLVSAGSPNISTSTYTPTRRSVKNWPEITYQRHRVVKTRAVESRGGKKNSLININIIIDTSIDNQKQKH